MAAPGANVAGCSGYAAISRSPAAGAAPSGVSEHSIKRWRFRDTPNASSPHQSGRTNPKRPTR